MFTIAAADPDLRHPVASVMSAGKDIFDSSYKAVSEMFSPWLEKKEEKESWVIKFDDKTEAVFPAPEVEEKIGTTIARQTPIGGETEDHISSDLKKYGSVCLDPGAYVNPKKTPSLKSALTFDGEVAVPLKRLIIIESFESYILSFERALKDGFAGTDPCRFDVDEMGVVIGFSDAYHGPSKKAWKGRYPGNNDDRNANARIHAARIHAARIRASIDNCPPAANVGSARASSSLHGVGYATVNTNGNGGEDNGNGGEDNGNGGEDTVNGGEENNGGEDNGTGGEENNGGENNGNAGEDAQVGDDYRAILQTLLGVNVGSVFTITQVWTRDRVSLSINDKILIYSIVGSAVVASSFCVVGHRLLRNPSAARKWLLMGAINFTSWDIIGWMCMLLPGESKLVGMALTALLSSLAIFSSWR